MYEDMDKAARMATEAQVKPALPIRMWRGVVRWWGKQPPVIVIFFFICAVAVLVLMTGWEALNSARGWVMLAQGAAPAQVAFMAGIASTVGYVVFHRRASERFRSVKEAKRLNPPDPDKVEAIESRAIRSTLAAVLMAALSLWGIFSNLASKTALVANEAGEINGARTQLMADIITLENEVEGFNVDLILALKTASESRLAGMTAEARGWGMDNLDVAVPPDADETYTGPACLQDLRPRQRELCNAAHGSVNSTGIVGDVAAYNSDLEKHRKRTKLLADKRTELAKIHAVEGQEHWNAMTELSAGNVTPDQFRIWGMFLASLFFLFAAGLGWDELFEEAERRKAK